MDTPVTTLQKPTFAKESYASLIEIEFKPGKKDELVTIAEEMRADLEKLDGIKQFILIDRGDNKAMALAFYSNRAQQEAATLNAEKLQDRWEHLVAMPPVRTGCNVLVHQIF